MTGCELSNPFVRKCLLHVRIPVGHPGMCVFAAVNLLHTRRIRAVEKNVTLLQVSGRATERRLPSSLHASGTL